MLNKSRLLVDIEISSMGVSPYWPLHRFVAANPLSGMESLPFLKAVEKGSKLFGGTGLPSIADSKQLMSMGKISSASLQDTLERHNSAERLPDFLAASETSPLNDQDKQVHASLTQRLMIKYLAAFLDEGQASWPMPHRYKGFYRAWKKVAVFDPQIPNRSVISKFSDTPLDVILSLCGNLSDASRVALFERYFSDLSGWVGFIKWRTQNPHYSWQKNHPISLDQYLAARLILEELCPSEPALKTTTPSLSEGLICLESLEMTYRRHFLSQLKFSHNSDESPVPEAQFVFCIDVRSEVFRRHLEKMGPYETFGFAGFFGLPIRFTELGSKHFSDACPVLIQPKFNIKETHSQDFDRCAQKRFRILALIASLKSAWTQAKYDLVGGFGTVEMSGPFFGGRMIFQLLCLQPFMAFKNWVSELISPSFPTEITATESESGHYGMTLKEQLFYAETGLKMMGIKRFSPVVVFAGHGSETVNNPYAAGLECGACGGNDGSPNARLLASILNSPEVRQGLKNRHIDIPEETVFIGAFHNTTTDALMLYGDKRLPSDQRITLLRNLERTRQSVVLDRQKQLPNRSHPNRRATDFSEIRPEWGLAGNASFIAGPRSLSRGVDLKGRTFLHSYDWESDTDGSILQMIMSAPLVVAQWINAQYYFSSLDTAVYGSGSKASHNITGKLGVMQGNSSDLMTGLPLQSVFSSHGRLYHDPIRLQVLIYAPKERVLGILNRTQGVGDLVKNDWIQLIVQEPNSSVYQLYRNHQWEEIPV